MEKYTLFLDESSDKGNGLILVAGFTIPNNQLDLLYESVLEVKELIWDEKYIESHNTVLHCTELKNIYNNRRNRDLYKYIHRTEYNVFKKMDEVKIKDIYENIYSKLCEIVKNFDITVFGCKINEIKFNYLFETSDKILEDPYNIAIQVIIENFTHFLNNKNGVGYIIYESRNAENNIDKKSPDVKMYDNFCKIKSVSKGIPYINQNSINNRIRYFDIIRKIDENPGLELADFIVFNLFKSFFINDDRDKSEFMKKILKKVYNGGFSEGIKNLKNFYGIRSIPEDFQTINNLQKELSCLKKSYKNLKNEKQNIISKNEQLKQEKNKLKEKNKALEKELKALKEIVGEKANNSQ